MGYDDMVTVLERFGLLGTIVAKSEVFAIFAEKAPVAKRGEECPALTESPRSYESSSSEDPTVGLCLGL